MWEKVTEADSTMRHSKNWHQTVNLRGRQGANNVARRMKGTKSEREKEFFLFNYHYIFDTLANSYVRLKETCGF